MKTSQTEHVRYEEIIKVERNIPHKIKKRQANWIGLTSSVVTTL
jgi:hypothetical protein